MATDKSTWNKKQKVTQGTIDSIKRLGMKKALELAKMNSKAYQAGLVAEYQEATRRLYGDKRFAAATGTAPKKITNKISNPRQADKPVTKAVNKVKVKQETIDYIKKIGMTKALKEIQAYGQQSRMKPGNKEYETMRQGGKDLLGKEFATGVKRMYGERRFNVAASPKTKKK
jgi:hypothetical protein